MFDKAEIGRSGFVSVSDGARLVLLNRQIRYAAARSPFYRELVGNLPPLADLREIERLPFTDSETLRREGTRTVCTPGDDVARIVSLPTGGTTGTPKRLYFSEGDLERTVAFFAEGMGWMCAPGDTAAVLMPCGSPDGIGDLLCRGLTRLGAKPLPLGIARPFGELRAAVERERPEVLVGQPWTLRLLALTVPELRPRAVLVSGDYVPAGLVSLTEFRWKCPVLTHFGMTETGYGCAVEHPRRRGVLYLRRDELYAEVIDPDAGRALPPGETGELVLTTLRREAMPLLRCRTGDLAALTPDGDILRVCGRRTVLPEFYARQEALSPLPWLWDYREAGETLTAFLSPDAPENAGKILAEAAPGFRILTENVSPAAAAPACPGKRLGPGSRGGAPLTEVL